MLWYTDEWTAEFTESLTVNIDSAIQAGITGIKSPLESSIGAINGRTQKFNHTCGDRDIAPYTRTVYQVYQNVTLGKKAKVESTLRIFIDGKETVYQNYREFADRQSLYFRMARRVVCIGLFAVMFVWFCLRDLR